MQVTCANCGSARFSAGEIDLSSAGGYDIKMICAKCGTPTTALHETDPGLAQSLSQFFGQSQEQP